MGILKTGGEPSHPESPCLNEVMFTDNADVLYYRPQKYAFGMLKKIPTKSCKLLLHFEHKLVAEWGIVGAI